MDATIDRRPMHELNNNQQVEKKEHGERSDDPIMYSMNEAAHNGRYEDSQPLLFNLARFSYWGFSKKVL